MPTAEAAAAEIADAAAITAVAAATRARQRRRTRHAAADATWRPEINYCRFRVPTATRCCSCFTTHAARVVLFSVMSVCVFLYLSVSAILLNRCRYHHEFFRASFYGRKGGQVRKLLYRRLRGWWLNVCGVLSLILFGVIPNTASLSAVEVFTTLHYINVHLLTYLLTQFSAKPTSRA